MKFILPPKIRTVGPAIIAEQNHIPAITIYE